MRNKHSRVPDFNQFFTNVGSKFHKLFESRVNPDGTISLRESGRENIQDKINSHLAETDMSVIINRLQCGDTSVLASKPIMYGDFTQFPKSYADMLDLVIRSEKAFESLSPEIKQKFDNDRNKWFASVGSLKWMQAMGLSPEDLPADALISPNQPLDPSGITKEDL